MHIKFKLFILFVSAAALQSVNCAQFEGDSCTISGAAGTCVLISACPKAIESLIQRGITPQNCGYKGLVPIVCCSNNDIVSPGTTTTQAPPSRRIFRPSTGVGAKSRQKCEEYKQYVYEPSPYAGIGGVTPPPTDTCAIIEVVNIIGGTPAKPREFPHMALVGFDSDNGIQWNCGGSLISEKFVLSAAHCTFSTQYQDAKHILLGELKQGTNSDDALPEQFRIKNIITHPQYDPSSRYNDITLFELDRNAKLSSYVRPACLNTDQNLQNRLAIASGWGKTENEDSSADLLKVTLDMYTTAECNRTFRSSIGTSLDRGILEESQICAGSRSAKRDSCSGDSGGPLQIVNTNEVYCTYKILGITSFGKNYCGIKNIPAVYTRVSNYIKWIEDNVWP